MGIDWWHGPETRREKQTKRQRDKQLKERKTVYLGTERQKEKKEHNCILF
jgi:hypothetical protein